jgi:hypothetical protein
MTMSKILSCSMLVACATMVGWTGFSNRGFAEDAKTKASASKSEPTSKEKSENVETDSQLRARLEDLRKSLIDLGAKIGNRADAETSALKAEIEDELAAIDARLNESRQKLATATSETSEAVRSDLSKLLKNLSTNIDDLAGKIEKKPENKK